MGKKIDPSALMERVDRAACLEQAVPAVRDIETITAEILTLKQNAGDAIIGIGQRLIEAKEMLPHGAWLPWLEEQVEFSERTARNFMRLAREWTNRQALADLGAAKALTLLALPPEERAQFMEEHHTINGEDKTVIDMTSRELEQAIRERDKARLAAEAALAEIRTKLEEVGKAERKAAIAGDSDLAVFQLLFGQAQEIANKLHGLLIKAQGREDSSQAAGMQKALSTLAELIGKAAEV